MHHTDFRQNLYLALIVMLISISPLKAEESALHYDLVELNAYATMEVDNDTQTAVLYAQREGTDLKQLTDQINRLIAEAVKTAKQRNEIKVSTLGYRTSPRYQQQQLIGWRVRQSIRLESQNNHAMSNLLGSLQSKLALESLSYSISANQRQTAEETLTAQAISAFRKRAEQITEHMGRSRYRLVELTLQTIDHSPGPYPMRANMMAIEGRASSPTLEGGSQTLRVDANGKIELQLE
ncbi:MAG: SIMPL domain-containing protein [Candidatus Thiodiazotropha lotti]|nr:SIMPL domain-containing protein [Candidatus Thiodiazotropha endoloripes]MCG7899129.1 SIMPL domain-containing protein [Candidatus Thiodiazotropha weberae]MCG7993325.1 SIMPL domain-containing protein [Candidatus Thiodiazotropha lotti]MCG7903733.1 SIMPL domain-containing protein [Candidatus Thiodiazotropha weberae]MCG7915233.1 SIMPL domain-containing protein [Candidatus Thiodiazotropha weberae]MCG7998158.1 SIMPL domain-containing protein [Candidatus Thiodiazotropha lotti]